MARNYGGSELTDLLKVTGLQNHYVMVAFLDKIGRALNVSPGQYHEDSGEAPVDDRAFSFSERTSQRKPADTAGRENLAAEADRIRKMMIDPRYLGNRPEEAYCKRVSRLIKEYTDKGGKL